MPALVVVFLVLAAQFESFVHPMVIMMTVPLAVFGALIGLLIFGQSINLFSQIGIIVLVGLAAKNGILIVEFTNQLRDAGRDFREALVEASAIRLRPIIMTALATIMGALPLVIATGAGAESRRPIGVVIFTGLTAYDTQKIKESYSASMAGDVMGKAAIMGALNLYLDFINLFIMLLRLVGDRR